MSKILFSKNKMNEDFNKNNIVDDFNLFSNNPIGELLRSKEMQYFSQNVVSSIAVLTALITFGSFIIKLLYYVGLKGFLLKYGIPINSINYLNYNGLFDFLYYFFIFIGFAMPIYFFYYNFKIILFYKSFKSAFKYLIYPFFLILLLNVVICFITKDDYIKFGSIEYLELFISMIVIEIIIALIFVISFKISNLLEKKFFRKYIIKENNTKKNINLYGVIIIICIILFVISSLVFTEGKNIAKSKKQYCIINEQYAVVYQNENYYWTIPVIIDEEEDKIDLYKYEYKIIDKNGVTLVPESFESAKIN
jgi:hypothetical protein